MNIDIEQMEEQIALTKEYIEVKEQFAILLGELTEKEQFQLIYMYYSENHSDSQFYDKLQELMLVVAARKEGKLVSI